VTGIKYHMPHFSKKKCGMFSFFNSQFDYVFPPMSGG